MDLSSSSVAIQKKSGNNRKRLNPKSAEAFTVLESPRVLRSREIPSVHTLANKKLRKNTAAAAIATEGTSTNGPVPEKVPKAEDGSTSFHEDFPQPGNNVVLNMEALNKPSIIPDRQMSTCEGKHCLGGQNEEDFSLLLKAYEKISKKYKQSKERKLQEVEALFERQKRKEALHVKATNELVEMLEKENIWLKHQIEEAEIEDTVVRVKLLEHENAECRNDLVMACAKQLELIEELKSLQASHMGQDTHEIVKSQDNTCKKSAFQDTDDGEERAGERARDISELERMVMAEIDITSLPKEASNNHKMPNTQQKDGIFWQSLLESLTKLQLQVDSSFGPSQLTFLHHPTGLKFKLEKTLDKDISQYCGGGELSVEMISLGTMESVAPQWMQHILAFSMKQVHLFFSRIHAAIDAVPCSLCTGA